MSEILPGAEAAFDIAHCASSTTPKGFFAGEETAPLDALKCVVSGYINLALRSAAWRPLLVGDPGPEESDSAHAFEAIFDHVRAAQRAGALKGGDPDLITTLIVGAIVGAGELSRNRRVSAASGVRDLLSLPLFLIDRLTTKRCN